MAGGGRRGDGVSRVVIRTVVIPNASAFGCLILIGSALIVGAIIWRFHWEHMPMHVCMLVLLDIRRAAIGGIFLNINLHLANGGPSLAGSQRRLRRGRGYRSSDAAIQEIFVGVSGAYLARLRRG